MALEPITRQEQIIAGKDLEPITRMERFLKEYGGASSWNDLEDKPFGEEVTEVGGDTLTWDGNTEGLVSVDLGEQFYRVCDNPPAITDFANGCSITTTEDGAMDFNYADIEGHVQNSGLFLGESFLFVPETISQGGITVEKGIYFLVEVTSLTIPGYTGFVSKQTVVKRLDEKYMPILTSPNGTKFRLAVNDDGTVTTAEVTE